MSGRSRGQREAFEASTDDEARIIINSPEAIQQELNRLTFEPRRSSSPDPPEVGPDLIAVSLQHTAERDEARRERDEQVALRDDPPQGRGVAGRAGGRPQSEEGCDQGVLAHGMCTEGSGDDA